MNVREYNQNQLLMFPPSIRSMIKDNDPVLIVNDVIESMDLSILYRKISREGKKAYHPKMMLKILVYAYIIGIFSSRKIHRALGDSIAFLYLTARQSPDFRTISDFRKNNLREFRILFTQIVQMCQKMGMVSLGHVAIDGSKLKANASDSRTYDEERIKKEIDRLIEQAGSVDDQEDAELGDRLDANEIPEEFKDQGKRRKRIKELQEELKKSGRNKINATDPDAVFMKSRQGVKTSYNAQIAVEQSHQIIVAADVVNTPADNDQLLPMIEQTEHNAGKIDKLSADSGYSSGRNLQQVDAKAIDAHIPDSNYQGKQRGKKDKNDKFFPMDRFERNELEDCFVCPAGNTLHFWHLRREKNNPEPLRIYRCTNHKDCPLRSQCTQSEKGPRTITLNPNSYRLGAMRLKLDSAHGKRIYNKRKFIVEPVFGHIKETIGFRGFHLRGLQKVCGEFFLVCIAHNLRKLINSLKVEAPAMA